MAYKYSDVTWILHHANMLAITFLLKEIFSETIIFLLYVLLINISKTFLHHLDSGKSLDFACILLLGKTEKLFKHRDRRRNSYSAKNVTNWDESTIDIEKISHTSNMPIKMFYLNGFFVVFHCVNLAHTQTKKLT